ncbi:MAG: UDP-N-acetylglucosamine 1-carboxyvinyltransferase, partial [Christensenellaceae bacterium]|nr:UDP-N-acetylglucosamine 1-carboxyvinyltransferase [Christensenellaceae bacterium]
MEEKFLINGGRALRGQVDVAGAKNAAVGILPATILAGDVCVIENLPKIDDVLILLNILRELGAKVQLEKNGTATIDTRDVRPTTRRIPLARNMRASYYLVGALLGRFSDAAIDLPGGCAIGRRPIDLHIKGFQTL